MAQVSSQIDHTPTVLCLPTGGGKTITAVAIAKPYRTLWVAHRRELIYQAAGALRSAGIDPGLIIPGEAERPNQRFQVASIQTLARRARLPDCELLVVDEVHHFSSASYQILSAPRMLGLTATPWRMDGRGLKPPFESLVVGATPRELCEQGYLVEPDVFVPSQPDLKGLRSRGGDYEVRALAERMDRITGRIVENWRRWGCQPDGTPRPTVCFAVDVKHSQSIAERFRAAGVASLHIDGTDSAQVRDEALRKLANGELSVLSQCMLLTEGWDLPSLEVAIIARPTQSLGLHLQMIGRVSRACASKGGATILDHAGNHVRHGLMTDERDLTLAGVTRRHSPGAVARHCPECYLLVSIGTTECPACGAALRALSPREIREVEGDLAPMGPRREATFEEQLLYWSVLEEERLQRGYQQGWSTWRMKERFGRWPLVVEGKLIDPSKADKSSKDAVLARLRATAAEKGYKKGWIGYRFKAQFGHWPRGM